MLHRLRSKVFGHLQAQSIDFFRRTRGGEVQSRLVNDISGMQSVITSTATSIAANLTTVVATVIAMTALSWRLSLLSLVILPPVPNAEELIGEAFRTRPDANALRLDRDALARLAAAEHKLNMPVLLSLIHI